MTDLDPRTPVVVGVGATMQRCDDPGDAVEAVELMVRAVRGAGADSGSPALLAGAGWVGVPDGNWTYADAGRLVAASLGASQARTVVAEVGVLQQDLLSRACEVVARGDVDVALVVGGEARFRDQQAKRQGVDAPETAQPGVVPDDRWRSESLGIADVEIVRNIVNPVVSYALVDRALAAHRGWTVDEHRDRLAGLWHAFGAVAADNTDAWDRSAPSVGAIREATAGNRMLAFPYTKLMASQWNVDQAAALVVCSVEAARRHGVPEDRWVFPWASAVCNHSVPLVQRAELHRSPGAAAAARAMLEAAGLDGIGAVEHIDLYSCFPAAVEVCAAELGLPVDPPFEDPPTVTGGMTFAGGPLNNYVLQAMVRLVGRLRTDPGSVGLSSSVSGFLTKQGFSLWSTSPSPTGSFVAADVSADVAAVDRPRPLAADDRAGEVTIVASTVDRAGFEPRVVAVCEHPDGARTIGSSVESSAVERLEAGDPAFDVGASAAIDTAGTLMF